MFDFSFQFFQPNGLSRIDRIELFTNKTLFVFIDKRSVRMMYLRALFLISLKQEIHDASLSLTSLHLMDEIILFVFSRFVSFCKRKWSSVVCPRGTNRVP